MNPLELSLEILKILISKEEFDGLNFEEKNENIIAAFGEIYAQVLALTNGETIFKEEIVNIVEGADIFGKLFGNQSSSDKTRMISSLDGTNTGPVRGSF
ncbi:hypothetical protein QT990_09300 [Microcoleus sp. T3_B1]|uniref:hypothetical protein n=1 Tax=Microcoleus sp. T3_B1 TaxID=3055425 RepID=UPI002FD23D9B